MIGPSYSEIEALHRELAPTDEVFDMVFTHCLVVRDIADQLMARSSFAGDTDLVHAGCLLHDIGVYRLYDGTGVYRDGAPYISHGILGEAIIKEEGYSAALQRFASCHTGVGLTKKDIISQALPLPIEDYIAKTIEEKLVMYADKFHSKTDPPYFNSFVWYRRYVSRFGDDKIAAFEALAQLFGKPDLAPFIAKYGHALRGEA